MADPTDPPTNPEPDPGPPPEPPTPVSPPDLAALYGWMAAVCRRRATLRLLNASTLQADLADLDVREGAAWASLAAVLSVE